MKIVAGVHSPTEGDVLLDGKPLGAIDVKAMEGQGVFLVTQEPAIVNPLSVAENLMLGRWPRRGPWVDVRGMQRLAAEYLEGTGLDPRERAGRLSAVDRRKLNILRALAQRRPADHPRRANHGAHHGRPPSRCSTSCEAQTRRRHLHVHLALQ